jgi:hypothetical protein
MAIKTTKRTAPKPAAKKPVAPKVTPKKSAPTKPTATAKRVNTADIKVPAGREQKFADQALQLVDEAAALLRGGIRTGAAETAKSRIAAKKKASNLLTRATSSLTKALESSSKALNSVIGKL